MIILDTNIISELMRSEPDSGVLDWLDQQNALNLYLTNISVAEIYYGLSSLPTGKRRGALEQAFADIVLTVFSHRILDFDHSAAVRYGSLMAKKKKKGRSMSVLDGQIAAIASVNDAVLATRNTKDFLDCDVELVNPFQ